MHTGRSRNDEVATCIRIALRDDLLDLMDGELSFIKTLVRLAANHRESVIPGFTHTQHAQPTTLAHHLLAHADAALRDLDRLKDAYRRVNKSPLGAAAFASTGFDIDRARTADLLGFDSLVENSMDAVSSRDFVLRSWRHSPLPWSIAAAWQRVDPLVLIRVRLSGIGQPLCYHQLHHAPEEKSGYCGAGRAKTGSVIGSLVAALSICKALPMSYNRDLQEVTPHLWRSLDWTLSTVRILDGCLSSSSSTLSI